MVTLCSFSLIAFGGYCYLSLVFLNLLEVKASEDVRSRGLLSKKRKFKGAEIHSAVLLATIATCLVIVKIKCSLSAVKALKVQID